MASLFLTDSNTELPLWVVDKYGVEFFPMPYTIDDVEYKYDLGRETDIREFFEKMRNGSRPTTSMYSPQFYIDYFTDVVKKGQDILYVMFSSKLSGTYDCVMSAREAVLAEYPERSIRIVDTRGISLGAGLLVYKALQMREAGASDEEIAQWVESNRLHVNSIFTVSDLEYLKRGGRISNAAAFFGTMLDLKPIIKVDAEGKLAPADKLIGRKKALRYLVDKVLTLAENPEENVLAVLHADCEEDAQFVLRQLEGKIKFKEYWTQLVGPVIGTHAGPGTLAVCFMGKERE